MNLREFSDAHGGLRLVIRRHLESRKAEVRAVLDEHVALALRLARMLNDGLQGLSFDGSRHAFDQGAALAALGIFPDVIICGTDQRNIDGAQATAEGIASIDKSRKAPSHRNPGVTYPYYADLKAGATCFGKYGDRAVHRHLSGRFEETRGLWVEPVEAFAARLMGAVEAIRTGRSQFGLELWDLNFEQMVALYHLLVVGTSLPEIACEPEDAHDPAYGAGIVVASDGTIAEFSFDLQIGSSAKLKK